MLSKRFPNIERRSPRYLDVWDAAAGAGQTCQEYAIRDSPVRCSKKLRERKDEVTQ